MNDTLELTAQKIADRGRDALVTRLRPAFEKAAATHSDVLALDDEQVEGMVQRAADRADGLQWRRALAGVASEELGIGLGEALSHPAVARAQALVGAPSYEDGLAELEERRESEEPKSEAEERAPQAQEHAEHEPAPQEHEPEAEANEDESENHGPQTEEHARAAQDNEPERKAPETMLVPAIHLAGLPDLPESQAGLELRFSDKGVEVIRDGAALARMRWHEIRAIDVPVLKAGRLRRRSVNARLVIQREQGDASFEIPGVTPDELHEDLAPLVARQR